MFTVIALPATAVIVTPAVIALCAQIGDAIRRARIKQSAAAEDMGMSEPRLSEAVGAVSPLDVRRLAVLGERNPRFWRELIAVLADSHGLAVVQADVAALIDGVDALVKARTRPRAAKAAMDAKQDARVAS